MSQTFKAGDKVYCPFYGFTVFTIERNHNGLSHPLLIQITSSRSIALTLTGEASPYQKGCCIIPATPENQKLLEQLYQVKFEDAPPPKQVLKGSELTKHLLKKGNKNILCYVSNDSDEAALKHKVLYLINGVSPSRIEYFAGNTSSLLYQFAVPIKILSEHDLLNPMELEV